MQPRKAAASAASATAPTARCVHLLIANPFANRPLRLFLFGVRRGSPLLFLGRHQEKQKRRSSPHSKEKQPQPKLPLPPLAHRPLDLALGVLLLQRLALV